MDILQSLIPYLPAIVILSGAIAYGIKRYSDGKLFELKARLENQKQNMKQLETVISNRDNAVILIVEDDENDQFILKRIFKSIGMENGIVIKDSPGSALDYLRENHDIIMLALIDIKMNANGHRLLETIKMDNDLKGIPIIMLTGADLEFHKDEFYELGAIGYLQKPLDIFKLLTFLNNQGFSIHIEK